MKRYNYLIILIIILLSSCGQKQEFYKIEGETQGTKYSILFEGKYDNLKKEVDSVLHAFDMSLSNYEPTSIISQVNQSNNVEVDDLFKEMFYKAKEVTEQSDGAFDITLGPIINAYGFGYEEIETEIDSILIDSLLEFVGMNKVRIENNILIKDDVRIKISGNAIAQGQAVDIVSAYIETKGIKNYMVEIGGELKVKGLKYGKKWIIGIDKPIEGNDVAGQELQTILALTDKAMATSGNYRKFYIKDGKKYSHSINPKTGYPSYQNILSATVLAEDCMSADAYATACMVSGLEKSIKIIESDPALDAYFVYSDAETGEMKVYYTKAVENMIKD
ncbi:MAG: FAD:protein FMN transferase [Bacteroidales bacterium]|nr:FAD:protein FMN transferase [Bacteroidales bacterium]